VIELYIKHSLHRQQIKHDERQFMVLNSAERLYFMMGIAAYMAAKRLPNQIDKLQLDEAVRLLIAAIPDAVSQSVGARHDEESRPLRSPQRLEWATRREEIIHKINTDVRSCGLLVTDLSKDGSFKFAHKSYMELLQAQVIFNHSFASDKFNKLSGQSIANSWKLGIASLQNSEEVFNFFVELLSTHLHQQQGMSEESTIVKCLWDILVIAKLSNRRTVSSFLTRYWVLSASWLINSINWFGLKEPREIIISILPVFIMILTLFLVANKIRLVVAAEVKRDVREMVGIAVEMLVRIVVVEEEARTLQIIIIANGAITAVGATGLILFHILLQLGWLWYEALSLTTLIIVINLLCILILGLAVDFSNDVEQNPISKRLHLWYRACVSLGFAPETIEKVVGKGMTKLLAEAERVRAWRKLR